MRYIKVVLLVLIFFFFALFVVQNHAVLGQEMAFQLNLFVVPPVESIPLPLYFVLLVTLFLGALVSVLFLASDRIRMSMAVRRARKRIAVLEREVAQLRAIPLKPLKALEEGRPEPEKEVSSAPGVIAAGPAGSSEPTDPSEGKNPAQNNNQAGDKESGSVEKL